jgi:DNA-binding MarR family transcriptional regulator
MKTGKSMRELSEWDELKTFFDRHLIKALGHPVREHILAVLNERVASGREIGEELGADVSSFYHHVEELEKLGCIERIESRRRRGAREHFFRARRTVLLDDAAWRRIPPTLRSDLAGSFVQRIFDDVVAALESGALGSTDAHIAWTPARFDRRGWEEATGLLAETLARLSAIQEKSARRLSRTGGKAIAATVATLAFRGSRERSASGKAPSLG